MSYYLSNRPSHTLLGGLRGLVRLHRFAAAFVGLSIASVAARAVLPSVVHKRHARKLRRRIGRCLTRAACVRLERLGPRPNARMIVSNHLSWLDAFVLLGEVGARFVANSVWGAVPGLRTVLRANGVLFIERTRLRDTQQVGRRLHRLLGNGEPAVVFPEADTTRGERVLPFRPALLQPAASLGHPVAWLTLRYETPPGWPPASVVVSWADWTPLLVHMYRAFHPPWIAARIRFGEAPVAAPTRKELAAELYRRVAHDFEPQPQLPPDELASVTTPPPRPQRRF